MIEEIGGEVISLGTPGEEGGSGKHVMQREGFFDGVDAMMLIYPGRDNIGHSRALTATRVQFEYFGQAAHGAARPELAINALDAMNLACTGVAFLRQQTPSDVRIHYIITKGGTLANIVPGSHGRDADDPREREYDTRHDDPAHRRDPGRRGDDDRRPAGEEMAREPAGPATAVQLCDVRDLQPQHAQRSGARRSRATSFPAPGAATPAT